MKHILTLNEYRNQLEIPFDNRHPLHDKPTHVHILDALLKMSKKVMDVNEYTSNYNSSAIYDKWDENVDGAFELMKAYIINSGGLMDMYVLFINEYTPTDHPDYYIDDIKDMIENGDNDEKIIDKFDLYNDLETYLSEDGKEMFNEDEFVEKYFGQNIEETRVYDILADNITPNGLIPIWRAMSYDKGDSVDTYTNIIKFDGTGIFWSYDFDGAEAHWGGRGEVFILHGLVNPDYINWTKTIFKSAYPLNHEKEVELEPKKEILIYKVTDAFGKGIDFKKAMLVGT